MRNVPLRRLREAREIRGMTAAELAELVGVSTQSIYAYEKGTSNPGAIVLEDLSKALCFPSSFFFLRRLGESIDAEPVFYRSMKSAHARQRMQALRWLQLAVDRISYYEEIIQLQEVNLPSNESEYQSLSFEDIEDIAQSVRRHWVLGSAPISNVTLLLENNGFIIVKAELLSDYLDACSVISSGRPYIFMNSKKETCSRVIMNLAHELGHLVLHTQIGKGDLSDPKTLDLIEKQAWRFAGAFLMPACSFTSELSRTTLDYFITLKSRWRTSVSSMIMRCYDLGIIDDSKKEYLFREYARKRYRTHEPLDDTMEVEEPRTMVLCDEILLDNIGMTKDTLISDAHLYQDDYCKLTNAPDGFFAPQKPVLRLLNGFERNKDIS